MAEWDVKYEAFVEPQNATPAWTLRDQDYGSIVSPNLLFIKDTGGTGWCKYRRTLSFSNYMTVVARLKNTVDIGSTYGWLWLLFGTKVGTDDIAGGVYISKTRIADRSDPTQYVDIDMTEFHTIRMIGTIGESKYKIYIDETNVQEWNNHGAPTEAHVDFGEGADTIGGASESYWDYVYYTIKGAYSPGELPIHRGSSGLMELPVWV